MVQIRNKHQRTVSPAEVPAKARLRMRAVRAAQALASFYGSPNHNNKADPLDELIFIILSQMTTHPSFNRVFDRLKQKYQTWEQILAVPLHRLKVAIKDAGLSNQKAPRIKQILRRIAADFGAASLDSLHDMSDAAAERYLTTLPGVGTKTAKCVLMYSLTRQVLPVDTHVWRVARRLELVPSSIPYSRVHDAIESVVPKAHRYAFHVNAIAHGQQICTQIRPKCDGCPLRRLCPF